MAKKKAKKVSKKKTAPKKAAAKAVKKTAKKTAKKLAKKTAKKAPARKAAAKKAVKAPLRKKASAAPKKAPARKKKQIVGEGDYEATRAFDRDQAAFVKANKAKIPAMAKAAEAALEGPEGDDLREAEATAAARSRDTF